jgi:hypothetical protein
MKYWTLAIFFFYSAALYSADLFNRPFNTTPVALAVNEAANEKAGGMTVEILEDSVKRTYDAVGLEKYNLSLDAFRYAMIGYMSLDQQGKLNAEKQLLTVIDFSKPSTEKRFWTIDLKNRVVKFHTYVSHGRNTGENFAKNFSNRANSNSSSLGFYVTAETYVGSKGYSLRLDGMDRGFNDNIRKRAVVMHDADYVSEKWIKQYGRLGRSQGCPALPKEISKTVIDTIKGGTAIFAYYPDETFLASSTNLDVEKMIATHNALASATQAL